MTISHSRLEENLRRIRQRIAAAAVDSGRKPHEVRFIAVTKYVDSPEARSVALAGCSDLGESRPQELWRKAEQLADIPISWHLIGPLQTNKIRRTLPVVSLIHSIGGLRLLAALNEEAQKQQRNVQGLLEVNISGETAKQGFMPTEVAAIVARLDDFPHVTICGLMGMASAQARPGQARREFASLRELRETLIQQFPSAARFHELSMGMSGDFEDAIAEGATWVRLGSALFDENGF